MRDVDTKVDGVDTMPAENYNAQRAELENAVLSADITLDPDAGPDTDLNMLGKAIAAYANAGAVYQDSGAADAYVLSIASNLKPVTKYYDNMMIVFKAGNSNTGASTVNVETLGVKSITLPDGTALSADDILTGIYTIAVYNLSGDRFEVVTTLPLHDHSDGANGGAVLDPTSFDVGSSLGSDITSIKDEDDMASDSPTALITQQSGKAYMDAHGVVQEVHTSTGAVATGTTQIRFDDTIPQKTEGDEYMTLAITPTKAGNSLVVQAAFNGSHNNAGTALAAALFLNAESDARDVKAVTVTGVDNPQSIAFPPYVMTAADTSVHTFKVRAGGNQAGTTTFNGTNAIRRYGGVLLSSITITEVKA